MRTRRTAGESQQRGEGRWERSEVGSQKSEARGQKPEVRSQRSEVRNFFRRGFTRIALEFLDLIFINYDLRL